MEVKKKKDKNPGVASYYPNPWEAEAVELPQFKTSLDYFIHVSPRLQYKILSNK